MRAPHLRVCPRSPRRRPTWPRLLLLLLAAVYSCSGCRAPLNVPEEWIGWFNGLSHEADSLTAAIARGDSAAAVALVPLLRAAEDSIPWDAPAYGAGNRRRLLAHLIGHTQTRVLAGASSNELRLDHRLQQLGRRADSLWNAGATAGGRAAWLELRQASSNLARERALPLGLEEPARVGALIARALAAPFDAADSAIVPRVTTDDLNELQARLDSFAAVRRILRQRTDARLPEWERRLHSVARLQYVARHNALMAELVEASRADAQGSHRAAATAFARVALRADSLLQEHAADTLLLASACSADDSTEARGDAQAMAELRRLAEEDRDIAFYNHAARRYEAISRDWAAGRLPRAQTLAAIESLLTSPAVGGPLRSQIRGLREDVTARP